MKKTFWLVMLGMLLLPLVSAKTEGLDLYYLFVENVFGGFLWATLGLTALFVVFGMLSRMSATLLIFLCALFIMVSLIGYMGFEIVFIFFILAGYYMVSGFIKWITGMF